MAEPWYAYGIVAVALAGTALNVRRHRGCWPVWMVSNAGSALYLASAGLWTQAALQAVFLAMSVWGWVAWGKDRAGTRQEQRRGPGTATKAGTRNQPATARAIPEPGGPGSRGGQKHLS